MHVHPEFSNELVRQRQRELASSGGAGLLAAARRRERDAHWAAAALARELDAGLDITIRLATPADARALVDLAILDNTKPLSGELLVAEVEGGLRAACSLEDGRSIADPFQPTRAARALLELRQGQIAAAQGHRQHPVRLRRRLFRQLRVGG